MAFAAEPAIARVLATLEAQCESLREQVARRPDRANRNLLERLRELEARTEEARPAANAAREIQGAGFVVMRREVLCRGSQWRVPERQISPIIAHSTASACASYEWAPSQELLVYSPILANAWPASLREPASSLEPASAYNSSSDADSEELPRGLSELPAPHRKPMWSGGAGRRARARPEWKPWAAGFRAPPPAPRGDGGRRLLTAPDRPAEVLEAERPAHLAGSEVRLLQAAPRLTRRSAG